MIQSRKLNITRRDRVDVRITKNASESQIKYIEALAIDLDLNRERRTAHIRMMLKNPANFNGDLDILTMAQASDVISQMKEWKENLRDKK